MDLPAKDTVLLRKKYRILVDLEIAVTDISQESVERELQRHPHEYERAVRDPGYRAEAERDRRMLHRLLSDPELLEAYLRCRVAYRLDELSSEELGFGGVTIEEGKIVDRLIETLEPADAEYYEELKEEGELWEDLDYFDDAFSVEMTGIYLVGRD